jgi:hypothetical protein
MFESEVHKYDLTKFNFHSRIQDMFKFPISLEALHEISEERSQVTFDGDTKTNYQRTFYDSPQYEEFRELYYEFVRAHIFPLFPDETALVVQKDPGFRVCPIENTALGIREGESADGPIGMHTDSEYNHPPEEVNFIIAVTEMWDTNSVYFESEPGKGDFTPLFLRRNEFIKICANQLRHHNLRNISGQTRVSIDFRVIPFSKYNADNEKTSVHSLRKLTIGDYFIKMDKV